MCVHNDDTLEGSVEADAAAESGKVRQPSETGVHDKTASAGDLSDGEPHCGDETCPESFETRETLPRLPEGSAAEAVPPVEAEKSSTLFPEGGELISNVVGELEGIHVELQELKRSFEGKLKYDKHKDEIIDRQHKEIEEYKQDLVRKATLPIINDVIFQIDDTEKLKKHYQGLEPTPENFAKILKLFTAFTDDLILVLDKNDVSSYSSAPGSPFDPKRQRAGKTTPTDDPALEKTVQESFRRGFEMDGRVVRAEVVAVYVSKNKKK